jgi:tetratricopeptide (TPR) repeat protein
MSDLPDDGAVPADLAGLVERTTLDGLEDEQAFQWLGRLIDLSGDAEHVEGLELALELAEELRERDLTSRRHAVLHYFQSNAIESLRVAQREGWDQRAWEQPELEEAVVHLRLALDWDDGGELSSFRRAQVPTNLGNTLSHHGRVVEALRLWDDALEERPSHGMAMMNRGYGLVQYSGLLPHAKDRHVLGIAGYSQLVESLKHPLPEPARQIAESLVQQIAQPNPNIDPAEGPPLHEHSLGESEDEQAYRRWVLERRLFLNPLNELGPISMAAEDSLLLPSLTTPVEVGPYLHSFFAQMKQEFVSARFIFYDGTTSSSPHFSDRRVTVPDTPDRPSFSLASEKLKAAFRAAYSLLDKVAFFINDYLDLGELEHRVNFRKIWYVNRDPKQGLRQEFLTRRRNYPLQGLFWLSKDLFEDAPAFDRPIDPRGKEIWNLRNALEHRYVKLLRREVPAAHMCDGEVLGEDRLARRTSVQDFEGLTLRLFRVARAAIIYLVLAVYIEEADAEGGGDEGYAPVMPLSPLPHSERV